MGLDSLGILTLDSFNMNENAQSTSLQIGTTNEHLVDIWWYLQPNICLSLSLYIYLYIILMFETCVCLPFCWLNPPKYRSPSIKTRATEVPDVLLFYFCDIVVIHIYIYVWYIHTKYHTYYYIYILYILFMMHSAFLLALHEHFIFTFLKKPFGLSTCHFFSVRTARTRGGNGTNPPVLGHLPRKLRIKWLVTKSRTQI